MTNTLKENWEKVDETCPNCGQITKKAKGITRQNIQKLFSIQVNFTEFLITFMLIMLIVLALSYKSETAQSREWINQMTNSGSIETCELVCNSQCRLYIDGPIHNKSIQPSPINLSFPTE